MFELLACRICHFIFSNLVPGGPPQNFTAIGVSSTSVRLQWDPPARKHQNGNIILYEVMYHQRNHPARDWTTNTSEISTLVDGLETMTDYIFQIRSYTSVGPGPWSNRLPFRTFPYGLYSLLFNFSEHTCHRMFSDMELMH